MMQSGIRATTFGLTVALGVSAATAAPTSTAEFAANVASLSAQPVNNDLINGIVGINEGQQNGGIVGAHEACVMNQDDCLSLPPICSPSAGVRTDLGASLADFTDGVAGTLLQGLLTDFTRASIILRYDLPGPIDIGQINVIAANEDPNAIGNGRIFQTYLVEASTDNGANFAPLGPLVTSGTFGLNNQAGNGASLTTLFDNNSNVLATGVTNLRFVFYCVSNTQGFYQDPWQGNATEGAIYQAICPDVDVEDSDGRRKAFEAPIIKEIDVLAPGTPPFQCNDPVFDVVGGGENGDEPDGAVDAQDFGIFQTCHTGPGDPGGVFDSLSDACKCMDITGAAGVSDRAISQDDFGVFQLCATGPTPATPASPTCDDLP